MPPPPASALAEQELADRARDGDEQAFGELFHRHAAQLHRHAWRMLRDDAAAGDVVQEAFLRAITAMPRTREGLRFRAWMFRIVTNLCLRELTQRGRHGPAPDPETLGASEESSPEEQRARREWARLVTAALEELPARYRQILLLRELEGLDYDELGEALELSPAMVKVTLHRARARLRALVVTGQIVGNVGLAPACGELARLAASRQGHQLERHLESCPRCRGEQPSVGNLLAALPPPPPLPPDLMPPLPRNAASPASQPASTLAPAGGLSSGSGLAGWGAGVGAAVALAGAVALAVTVTRSARGQHQAVAVRPLGPGNLSRSGEEPVQSYLPGSASDTARPAQLRGRPGRRTPPTGVTRARRRRLGPPVATPPARVAAAVTLSRQAGPASRAAAAEGRTELRAGSPLDLQVMFLPGTLLVERRGKSSAAQPKQKLHAGDLLATRGSRAALLGFPEAQWLVFSGRLRLLEPPEPGDPTRVHLLGGELRAKATRRGHGLLVAAGPRECLVEQGEFRLRLQSDGLRVESLTAVVHIRGPHAELVLPRASQAVMAGRPGFSQPLLPGPETLRPVNHRGTRPPLLTWEPVRGASGYRVLVAAEPNFWIPQESAVVVEPRYQPRTASAGRHFWQVVPLQGKGEGYPSKVYAYFIEKQR